MKHISEKELAQCEEFPAELLEALEDMSFEMLETNEALASLAMALSQDFTFELESRPEELN